MATTEWTKATNAMSEALGAPAEEADTEEVTTSTEDLNDQSHDTGTETVTTEAAEEEATTEVEASEGSDADAQATAETAEEGTSEGDESSEEETTEDDQEGTDGAIEFPKSLTEVDPESLTDEGRQIFDLVKEAHREMMADYTRKSQEVAGIRRVVDQYEDNLDQIAEQFNENGVSEHSFGRKLGGKDIVSLAVDDFVRTMVDRDYRQTKWQGLGQEFRSPDEPGTDVQYDDDEQDPRVRELQAEIEQLKQKVHGQVDAERANVIMQADEEALVQEVEAFEQTYSDLNEEVKERIYSNWKLGVDDSLFKVAEITLQAEAEREAQVRQAAEELAEQMAKDQFNKMVKSKKKAAPVAAVLDSKTTDEVEASGERSVAKSWEEARRNAEGLLRQG